MATNTTKKDNDTRNAKAEASLYELLLDMLETQSEIIRRLDSVERKLDRQGGGADAARLWKGM